MASEAWRLHEQLGNVGLHTGTARWLEWGHEYCPTAVIREAEAEVVAEETWQHAKTPSSTQAVSVALAPEAWSTEDASMEPAEDAQEAGVWRSTRARNATIRGKAAVRSRAPSSSDDAKMAEQAGSAATAAEEVSGAVQDLDEVADDSGDEGGESAKLRGAADTRGASTTSTVLSKRLVEDEDNEEAPPSKFTRADMVTPGGSRCGQKPLPDQEPQTVSRQKQQVN
jgi:hypothetical protein